MRVERSVLIAAPPQAVYDLTMDPQRLGDWVTIHERLVEAPPGRLEAGAQLVQRLRVAGWPFEVRWTVTVADPLERVAWSGVGPMGTAAGVTYDLEAHGTDTLFRYANEFVLPGGVIGQLAGPAVAVAAGAETERSLSRLKALLEATAASPPPPAHPS